MYFTHTKDGRTLTAALHGEIDHHSAKTARTQLDLLIERENPKVLRLQLADVGFCDSSGLGFIMGRLKKMSETGGELIVAEPSPAIDRLLALSGLDKMIKIARKV